MEPFARGAKCLPLQQELIKYITSIERKIRSRKISAKAIRRELSTRRPIPFSKVEAQGLKSKKIKLENEIAEYAALLTILRDVGDGLAYTYLDRFDIKPMAFKSSPGFLSGKEGGRLERQFLRHCFKEKNIAILNDLTNCLRYGDVTVIDKENGPTIAEVKSGSRVTERGMRQIAEMQALAKYFREDTVDKLYGFQGPITRHALTSEERHHRDKLNALIALSIERRKSSYEQVEEGLFYVVEIEGGFAFSDVVREIKGKPMYAITNEYKQNNIAYFPFPLSFSKPEHIFQFYAGEFVVVVVADSYVIESIFRSHNLNCKFLNDESWAISVSGEKKRVSKIQVGQHFWGRLPVEFLSLKWFLEEIVQKFEPIEDEQLLPKDLPQET